MSEVDSLLAKYCPEGVERFSLDQLGTFYGGLTGKGKSDFEDGNAKYITYMNVYSNPATNLDINDSVKIKEGERQNKVEQGDVFFTVSSETPEECGFTSVIEGEVIEPIYLNSFCCGYRIKDKSLFNFSFLKHVLRSKPLRQAICRCANGVTRFNISKKQLGKVTIPVPPLQIQTKIADILDSFTTLEAELEAELEARKKQYRYYLNQFFGGDVLGLKEMANDNSIVLAKLDDKGTFTRGRRFVRNDVVEDGYPCIHYGDMYTYYGVKAYKTRTFITPEKAAKLRFAEKGDVVIVGAGENKDDIGVGVAWLGDGKPAVHDACYVYHHTDDLDPLYVSYYLRSKPYHQQIWGHVVEAKICSLSDKGIGKAIIPVRPIEEQRRIAAILDDFDTLVNDTSEGLKAEIAARHKQYEYYRDQLLTFKHKEA